MDVVILVMMTTEEDVVKGGFRRCGSDLGYEKQCRMLTLFNLSETQNDRQGVQ
jgi:hypothetical protein